MHFTSFVYLAVVAARGFAAPVEEATLNERALCPTHHIATYDDLSASLLTPGPPTSPYLDLAYHGFNLVQPVLPLIAPQSSPNQLSFGFDPLGATKAVHNMRIGPGVKSFTAKSFYFSCVVLPTVGSPAPFPCKIKVIGRKLDNSRVATFKEYKPAALGIGSTQQKASLSGFKDLQGLQFLIVAENAQDGLIAASFDNVEYTVFKKCVT